MEQQNNAETTSKKRNSFFKLDTLKSYAILLVMVFVLVIICLNIFSYVQNTRQLMVSREISDIRMPVSLRAQDILIGLNQTSTAQRGFLITGDKSFIEERKQVWETRLLPSLAFLSERKAQLGVTENIRRIEKLEELLPKYQQAQEKIDQQKLLLIDKSSTILNTNLDSLGYATLLKRLEKTKSDRATITRMINENILPLQEEIRAAIAPLINTQEEVLKESVNEVVGSIETNRNLFLLFSMLSILVTGYLSYVFIKKLKTSIIKPTRVLEQLAEGKLANNLDTTSDELNQIVQAGNRLSQHLSSASAFAKSIGEGNFKSGFQPASEEDILGNALVHMRDQLSKVAEEDKRRNWSTSGLAQISDLLRDKLEDVSQLYFNIVRFIVRYLNANQGGLFLLNEENQYLELVACYAYERQKFLKKTVALGEGLIGQAYVEREPIFLTEVPDSYVQIRSGLGDANPRCIIIAPLKVNEEVTGVIELASFKVLEDYEVEFVNKVAETIASAISSIKVNERTTQLLEETQQQAEEMRAQEEEMRQNNEELQATQEEMRRKSLEAEERNVRLDAVLGATVDAIVTIDENGNIETANPACENLFGYSREELIGNNVKMLMSQEHASRHDGYLDKYHKTGERKVIGKSREVVGQRKDGSSFPLSLAVNEVMLADKKIFTGIMRDISEQKELQDQLKQQLEEAKASEEELRQNMEELNSIQEALAAKNEEVEKIRAVEKERAKKQITAQTKMMEKAMAKFKTREKELLDQLKEKGA